MGDLDVDPAIICRFAEEVAFDLPAGGKRLLQRARGYVATIKSGKVTFRDGVATGERPGVLIRGPQGVPMQMAAE